MISAAIKALGGVGGARDNTFVAMDAGGIDDHATNEVEGLAATAALKATMHAVDITPATLVSFDADLATNKLTLSFSEDVVLRTFNVTEFVLQAAVDVSCVFNTYLETTCTTSLKLPPAAMTWPTRSTRWWRSTKPESFTSCEITTPTTSVTTL